MVIKTASFYVIHIKLQRNSLKLILKNRFSKENIEKFAHDLAKIS